MVTSQPLSEAGTTACALPRQPYTPPTLGCLLPSLGQRLSYQLDSWEQAAIIPKYCKCRYFRVYKFSRICYKVQFRVYLNSRILENGSSIITLYKFSLWTYFNIYKSAKNMYSAKIYTFPIDIFP